MTAPIQYQSVELFQVVEGAFVKHLKTRLLLCAIKGALGRVVTYFTYSNYTLPIGLWVGVVQIIPLLGTFLGAVPAV